MADAISRIRSIWTDRKNTPSDINQHLDTLANLAKSCVSVAEFGVRSVVSTWAFLYGLAVSESVAGSKFLISVDLKDCNTDLVADLAKKASIGFQFVKCDSATCIIPDVDLVFIDTWHVYGQLERELQHLSKRCKKYLVLHDTTVDGGDADPMTGYTPLSGETIRNGWDAQKQSAETGIPVEKITKGLWPAVVDFLALHPEWVLKHRYTHNNGLTVLERVSDGSDSQIVKF